MLRVWNMALVALSFVLALLGTFITRSGIISSVHAFGESTLGAWFLVFIAIALGLSVALIVLRLPELRSEHSLESFVSREAVFLYNNLLLLGLAFAVLWGTLFPVLSEAVRGTQITVGQGFYNQIAVPIGVALLILTGVGPLIPWRRASLGALGRRFAVPLAVGGVVAVVVALTTPGWDSWVAGLVFSSAGFVAAAVVGEFLRGAMVRYRAGGVSALGAVGWLFARNRRRYGVYVVHLGVALLFVGLAGSSAFSQSGTLELARGQTGEVGGYEFTYVDSRRSSDEHRGTVGVTLDVSQDGRRILQIEPQTNFYFASEQRSSEIAVDSTYRRDLYVALLGLRDDVASISVFVNPLVMWIWIAGALMALGTVIAIWPRRRERRPARERVAEKVR